MISQILERWRTDELFRARVILVGAVVVFFGVIAGAYFSDRQDAAITSSATTNSSNSTPSALPTPDESKNPYDLTSSDPEDVSAAQMLDSEEISNQTAAVVVEAWISPNPKASDGIVIANLLDKCTEALLDKFRARLASGRPPMSMVDIVRYDPVPKWKPNGEAVRAVKITAKVFEETGMRTEAYVVEMTMGDKDNLPKAVSLTQIP